MYICISIFKRTKFSSVAEKDIPKCFQSIAKTAFGTMLPEGPNSGYTWKKSISSLKREREREREEKSPLFNFHCLLLETPKEQYKEEPAHLPGPLPV